MGIRKYKPTTPGRRGSSVSDFVELTRSTPEKSLLAPKSKTGGRNNTCLLYTSDAADERSSVDLGGRRIIQKNTKKKKQTRLMVHLTRETLTMHLTHESRIATTHRHALSQTTSVQT